ncbi:MAG: SMC family ATPase [Nocardioides sp.]|uniref:AAA family ATPase n=1 Tax=Nocardioides sp. TaxID=35761 RepID=UPI0039E375B3
MRLHRLEATAFGPFADTVTVDFDALTEAGLFLLSGATGAGKTSVLDAVCFALYGDVPGDRASARRLRSDQAGPEVAPRVLLECTLAGRRFVITRAPAWQRPKKRGSGTTPQQATVTVVERVDGQWQPLTSRLDEAGHLISGLVGLTLVQFTQVALLPQGRFQTFLRARSEDRHKLLQQLFRTSRFEQVERWLRDHRLALAEQSRGHERAVAELTSRLSEAADVAPPDPVTAEGSDPLTAWADRLAATTATAAQRAATALASVTDQARAADEQLDAARELVRLQHEHTAATTRLAELAAQEPQLDRQRAQLEAARRAVAVVGLAEAEAEARIEVDLASSHVEAALNKLADTDHQVTALAEQQAALTARAAAVRALAPRAARRADLLRVEATDHETGRVLAEEEAALIEERAALPGLLADARQRLDGARRADQAVAAQAESVRALEVRVEAARDRVRLLDELAAARVELLGVIDTSQQLREELLTLRERRLTGMAAELAGQLASGDHCPVCGSHEHPHPAEPLTGAPDAATERAAQRRFDDAETLRHVHDSRVRDLETRAALADQRAGAGVEQLLSLSADETARLAALRAEAETMPDLVDQVADLERRGQLVGDRLATLGSERAALTAASTARADEIAAITDELRQGLGGDDVDPAALADRLDQDVTLIDAALTAKADLDRAESGLRAAVRRATAAARKAGFEATEEALASAVDAETSEALAAGIKAHETALAATRAILADDTVTAAAAEPAPDLTDLGATAEAAAQEQTTAHAAAELATRRSLRVRGLADSLDSALTAWQPVRSDLELATRMASFVEGKSPDNKLAMRLSAYVLAHRLGQVVASANQRLATMSDQRYTLEHTGRRGAGETRGGLSLLIRDDWSGEARDPATLSGGETFVVSLALALGLADVITQEVGGAELDTLFVDEGFGSLDADTLDDVMDTLDTLRDGGRVVGVVSHVPEMKDRIPTQLAVRKQRRGSTVELVRPS